MNPGRLSLAALAVLILASSASAAGSDTYLFDAWEGAPLRVFVGIPEALSSDAPVVIVMHGVRRNADTYRDQWLELARTHGFLLAVPEFSDADFPGSTAYQQGGVTDEAGNPVPQEKWAFSAIEPLFDSLRHRYGLTTESYGLYGHSAGAQFVHRFVMHVPEARLSAAVAANAGWYTLPDGAISWPYGLGRGRVDRESLAVALQAPLTILLGDRDTDPAHPSLRRTPEALQQGLHRFQRGFIFFESGRREAERLGVSFGWHLSTVRGADHDNRLMAPEAVPYLLP